MPNRGRQELRIWLIELLAYWEGGINTTRLRHYFDVSRQQASSDLNLYQKSRPKNLHYSQSFKRYEPTSTFTFLAINGTADEYLQWLTTGRKPEQYCTPTLSFETIKIPSRQISPTILRTLIRAIETNQRVEVDYRSISSGDSDGRIIAPHALVKTSARWHIRAWCEKRKQFRDFVLSRFQGEAELLGASKNNKISDKGWNTLLTIRIQADERLSSKKRAILEFDHSMINGVLSIECRACFTHYILQDLNVSIHEQHHNPEVQQLVVINKEEIESWLF